MIRIPTFVDEFQKYVGKTITKEMLFGRGYCLVRDGIVVEDSFPMVKELSWEEDFEDDAILDDDEGGAEEEMYDKKDEITCKKVKKYIAEQLDDFVDTTSDCWIKGIPAEPEDVDNQEVYMIVCISTRNKDSGLEITNITILARMVEQIGGGWFSVRGVASMESFFFEMQMVPPELVHEIELLISCRYIPENFTFIGKPMPGNKEMFYSIPSFSLAKNSGWRNVYWHLNISVDDSKIIKNIDLSTYERETSMCQRPYLMSDDMTDAFDAALMIVDLYSDEEWANIQ